MQHIFYYIKLKSHLSVYLSVCLSVCLTITLVSQPCQHGLKRNLLKMEAESSRTMKYFFVKARLFIHMSAQKALV